MKKSIKLLCLLWMLCVATASFANGINDNDNNSKRYLYALRGVVVDENNEPLAGAAIHVAGTTFGAGTNSSGEFVIRLNDAKRYVLQVSFMGYEPQNIEAVASQNPVILRIKLQPSDNQLNEVVVTGSFIEKPLMDVPVLTRIISRNDIQALNPMNVETLLQYELPGLQIGYNSMSQQPEITYQGMGGEYMLFLIDGERVSGEGSDHNVDFSRFNVDDIERIEVVKGAQSTIYGSNALGGVVNIITRTANRPFAANLNARYAGSNGQKYNGSIGLKKDRLTSFSSLTYRTKDTYTIDDGESGTSSTLWGYNIWDFTQKLGYTCNEKLSADIKGTYYRNQRDIRPGRLYQEYYVDHSLSGKVKYLPAENQQLVFGYIYDNYKKDNHYFRIDSTYTNYRNIKQTPRVDYTGKFGRHTVSAGFEGDIEYLKHYMLKDSSHVSNQAYAFYAQEDWNITDQLNIVAGVRADYHEKYHWHVTPKISVMWRFRKHVVFRAGYAQGFRSPSLKELYMSYDMGGLGMFMIYGNPNLKPETSNQYSLSAEFNKGGLNMAVAFSHNRFKNKIDYMAITDEAYGDMQYVNAENAKTSSVEGILRYRFGSGLIVTCSYAYTKDYAEVDGRNASLVRPHSATFNAMYSHKFGKVGFNCSLNGQWGAGFDTYSRSKNDDGSVSYKKRTYDARTLCSLNAGVTFPRGISLNVGMDNLLNYKDKAADSTLQVPQKGISVIGTVNINIADMFGL
ncbi:TonB-dependent receptor [Bacteroides helcogenes]|uniref:TonB-dependent receptor n=1 Tax=Bacteroides helcogenes (strain ATCC 35417 / DSM 20613 / JCM 6297 / CCUG 15421 / P 36-108) TaxID=693979 RepID=E6SRR4_BACT6|nr:TonB-dependent receptor [Bacteroides helcogenes]ADV45154.1 TonB-dependent receptor [Bacteroides helcogenes P 36-108]MDY5238713.1 TonB-dependent receptor [Bacteroides helcogenes]